MHKLLIKDICDVVNGSTPSTKNSENYDGNIVWITPKDLSDQKCRFIKRGERNITEKGYNSCSATLLPKGSILLSSRAPIGLISIADNICCTNQGFKNLVFKNDLVNNLYLYYYLKHRIKDIEKLGSGTTFKELSKSSLEGFVVNIHDKDNQELIANFLSALDDKIELNNKINIELEKIAKTLYDYWFVQFDFPDEKERPYKSSGRAMIYNKNLKREIPVGWEVKKLGEECKILLGGTPDTSKNEYWQGNIHWLNSGEIAVSPVVTSEKKITDIGMKNSSTAFAKSGAVIMSITRYIRPSILAIDACFNQSVVAIIPSEKYHTEYIYPFMKNNVDRYLELRTGAQQPHINKEIVENTLIVCPPQIILDNYYKQVRKLYKLQINKAKENLQLVSLRDYLLPLLMNGQVTITS